MVIVYSHSGKLIAISTTFQAYSRSSRNPVPDRGQIGTLISSSRTPSLVSLCAHPGPRLYNTGNRLSVCRPRRLLSLDPLGASSSIEYSHLQECRYTQTPLSGWLLGSPGNSLAPVSRGLVSLNRSHFWPTLLRRNIESGDGSFGRGTLWQCRTLYHGPFFSTVVAEN